MSTYAIGDLQGCLPEFDDLLDRLAFGATDELWLVGDLINRGSDTLGTLRRVYAMRDQCQIVLGNHDLHFLAIYFGGHSPHRNDTFDELLSAKDVDELAHWLVTLPLLHVDAGQGYVMAHAGVPHIWTLEQALGYAQEVSKVMKGEDGNVSRKKFFTQMYGNEPACWDGALEGLPRVKLITNYFTRMRFMRKDGSLDFSHKGALADAPPGWTPWYELVNPANCPLKIVFGHWAALNGRTSNDYTFALDTGCVWGRELTALNLQTGLLTSVDARG